jgi:RNA recognition motif-containing protein
MDYVKGKHRGFAFVEYVDADDADEAIFNMDGAELLGKALSVSVAQPNQVHRLTTAQQSQSSDDAAAQTMGKNASGSHGNRSMAIWSNDEWFQQQTSQGKEEMNVRPKHDEDVQTLREM